jgi:hypothetical protein
LLLQLALLSITLWLAGRALMGQWGAVRESAARAPIAWSWVAIASVIVLGTYAALIQSWRMLLAGWGSALPFGAAVRIWTIANLGRYLPGKVWSIGALGILAKREGVSGVAAAGAAILGTLLNIGAGFGIMALSGTRVLGTINPWLQSVALAVSVCFVVGTLLLPLILPPVLARVAAWRGLPAQTTQLPAVTLWKSTAINALSWAAYGIAFAAFAKGVAPSVIAAPAMFITIWTASYLGGYISLFAPGGIGVREFVMSSSMVALGLASIGDATFLALASRAWLTVWEILPGVLALVWSSRRSSESHAG